MDKPDKEKTPMGDEFAIQCYLNGERKFTDKLKETEARVFLRTAEHLCAYLKKEYRVGKGATIEEQDLRDRFAMAALTGLVGVDLDAPLVEGWKLKDFAKKSYEIADAMLAASWKNSLSRIDTLVETAMKASRIPVKGTDSQRLMVNLEKAASHVRAQRNR